MAFLQWYGTAYNSSTVAVTNGSPTVTITGASDLLSQIDAGQGFLGPDFSTYEIQSVTSTTIVLRTNYRGSTLSGQTYVVLPFQGYTRDAAYQLAQARSAIDTAISAFNSTYFNANGTFVVGTLAGPIMRTDAQLAAVADGSKHALILLQNAGAAEETAVTSYLRLSDTNYQQASAIFTGWVNADNTAATHKPYCGIHLVARTASVDYDSTPFIAFGNNSIRLCGGSTAGAPWNTTIPTNWCEVYTYLLVRAGAVFEKEGGSPAAKYALPSTTFGAAVVGYIYIGELSGTTYTQAWHLGWDGSAMFHQAYNLNTSAFIDGYAQALTYKIKTGSSPSDALTFSSSRLLRLHAYGAGTLTTDSSGNVTATSDLAVKRNVSPFNRGIEVIRNEETRPIIFQRNVEAVLNVDSPFYAGFAANNFDGGVLPEAIDMDEHGHLTLDYGPLLAVLWNAMRDVDSRLQVMETSQVN